MQQRADNNNDNFNGDTDEKGNFSRPGHRERVMECIMFGNTDAQLSLEGKGRVWEAVEEGDEIDRRQVVPRQQILGRLIAVGHFGMVSLWCDVGEKKGQRWRDATRKCVPHYGFVRKNNTLFRATLGTSLGNRDTLRFRGTFGDWHTAQKFNSLLAVAFAFDFVNYSCVMPWSVLLIGHSNLPCISLASWGSCTLPIPSISFIPSSPWSNCHLYTLLLSSIIPDMAQHIVSYP